MADIVYDTVALPDAFIGVTYEAAIAFHGNATALTAASASGLPAGLSLVHSTFASVTSVRITGTPTGAQAPGNFTVAVTLTDTAGAAVSGNYTMRLFDASQYPNRDTELGGGEPNAADIGTEWPTVQ